MLAKEFLAYLSKENLFKKTDNLLLAISGGLDSVVLAHLLKKNGYNFSLAHMNFQLRGKSSQADESFVVQLAHEMQIKSFIKKAIVDAAGKTESIQMQARSLRYDWFNHLVVKEGFNYLLTAHHAEDSFETVLLNLSRGTGIQGLTGILPKQNKIVRPLLFAQKEQLKSYAQSNNIKWREDESNERDTYKRNEIRHKVTPVLLTHNPGLIKNFELTSKRIQAANLAYQQKLTSLEKKYFKTSAQRIEINKNILQHTHGHIMLADLLAPFGFSHPQVNSTQFKKVGTIVESTDYLLNVDRSVMFLIKKQIVKFKPLAVNLSDREIDTPFGHFNFKKVDKALKNRFNKANMAQLDIHSLKAPLQIRVWESGDKFQPLGMNGQKKVSDFLIDAKVPLSLKSKQLVLCHKNEIIWLVGHQINDKYKITEQTDAILRIEYNEYPQSF